MQIFRRKIKKKKQFRKVDHLAQYHPEIQDQRLVLGFPQAVQWPCCAVYTSKKGAEQRRSCPGDWEVRGKRGCQGRREGTLQKQGAGRVLSGLVSSYPRATSWEYTEGAFPTHGALVTVVAQKTSTRREMTKMDSASSFQNVSIP